MNNTHTLEDSLDEGEARKIAMLGQNEDTPSAQNELNAALRATPAHVRMTMKILAIWLLTALIGGYGFLIFAASFFYNLPVSMVIGNQLFDMMFIFYILQAIGLWAAYFITITIYRSARRVYVNGIRGFFKITRVAIISSFSDVVFNTILIITSVVFFATLIKYLLCIVSYNLCSSSIFGW